MLNSKGFTIVNPSLMLPGSIYWWVVYANFDPRSKNDPGKEPKMEISSEEYSKLFIEAKKNLSEMSDAELDEHILEMDRIVVRSRISAQAAVITLGERKANAKEIRRVTDGTFKVKTPETVAAPKADKSIAKLVTLGVSESRAVTLLTSLPGVAKLMLTLGCSEKKATRLWSDDSDD